MIERLCPDHGPVIEAARHLARHVDDLNLSDVDNARTERARQCPQCWALNHQETP